MGQLGASQLGGGGIGSAQGAASIGTDGVEEDVSGTITRISFAEGLPAGWISVANSTPLAFVNVNNAMAVDTPYTVGAGGIGVYSGEDNYDGGDIEVKLTFVWTTDAPGQIEQWGAGPFDITNLVTPAWMGSLSDRSFDQLQPSRYSLLGQSTQQAFVNAAATYALDAIEEVADGVTPHTKGFRYEGIAFTSFFDGKVVDGPFDLNASEQTAVTATTRMGIFWHPNNITDQTVEIRVLEFGGIGSLWA